MVLHRSKIVWLGKDHKRRRMNCWEALEAGENGIKKGWRLWPWSRSRRRRRQLRLVLRDLFLYKLKLLQNLVQGFGNIAGDFARHDLWQYVAQLESVKHDLSMSLIV